MRKTGGRKAPVLRGSAGRRKSYRRSSTQVSVSIAAPRNRLKIYKSEFADHLVSLQPADPYIEQVKSLPDDWLHSNLVVIECPMLELGKAGVHMALQRLLLCSRPETLNFLLIVIPRPPTRRKPSTHDRPIRQWSEWLRCPFRLAEVCTCQFSGKIGRAHV